jgi:hypothetical protein
MALFKRSCLRDASRKDVLLFTLESKDRSWSSVVSPSLSDLARFFQWLPTWPVASKSAWMSSWANVSFIDFRTCWNPSTSFKMPLSVASTTLTSSRNCFTNTVTCAETWIKVTMLAVIENGSIVAHCVRSTSGACKAYSMVLKLQITRWEQEFSSSLIESRGCDQVQTQPHAGRPPASSHHTGNSHVPGLHFATWLQWRCEILYFEQ